MKVEYFIEYALREDPQDHHSFYEPIGVWAHGTGTRLQLSALFLPGNEARQEKADLTINTLIEQGVRVLPDGWLQEYSYRIPIMRGDGGPVYTTEQYHSSDEVAEAVLKLLAAKKQIPDPPLPA